MRQTMAVLALALASCGGGGGGGSEWTVDPQFVGVYGLSSFSALWWPENPAYVDPGYFTDATVTAWDGRLTLRENGAFDLWMTTGPEWDYDVAVSGTWAISPPSDGTRTLHLRAGGGAYEDVYLRRDAPPDLETWAFGSQFDGREATDDFTGWDRLDRDWTYLSPP